MNLTGNWISPNAAPLPNLAEITLWMQEFLGLGNDRQAGFARARFRSKPG